MGMEEIHIDAVPETQSGRAEEGRSEIPVKELHAIDHEHPDRMYNIAGATRDYQTIVQLETQGDEPDFIRLQGAIILKPEAARERRTSPRETTLIFLHAVKLALENARRLNVGFYWSFSPTDPEGKMAEWKRKYLDSGEIKKEVAANKIDEELTKIVQKITELNATGINVEITDVDNPGEYSDKMAERLNLVQKEIKKSS